MKALNPPIADWSGKRIWLVGASSGIGAALAERMLAAGAHVVLSSRRTEQLDAIASGHPLAHTVAFDVTDTNAWPRAMSVVQARLGGIDLVVMGAARYDPTHSWELDLTQVEKSFDLNVVSMYRGLSVIVPALITQGSGGIA